MFEMLQFQLRNQIQVNTDKRNARMNFFNTRWAHEGIDKHIDREMYELGAQQLNQVSEQIINGYKSCNGAFSEKMSDTRSNWMNNLKRESIDFLAQQRGMRAAAIQQEAALYRAVTSLVEKLFDLLQAYSYDFNQEIGWNPLQVTCTKPTLVTEVLRYNKLREPVESVTTFRGRLSTRFTSMVVIGRKNCVEFRLLPVEEVIGLTKAEASYKPFLSFECNLEEGGCEWYQNGAVVTNEMLEVLCMEAFTKLIGLTRDEAAANEAI
jgi:hypothetical protein